MADTPYTELTQTPFVLPGDGFVVARGGTPCLYVPAGTPVDAKVSDGRFQLYPAVNVAGVRALAVNNTASAAVPLEISGEQVILTNAANSIIARFNGNGTVNFSNSITAVGSPNDLSDAMQISLREGTQNPGYHFDIGYWIPAGGWRGVLNVTQNSLPGGLDIQPGGGETTIGGNALVAGNLLVGLSSGTSHRIRKVVSEGAEIARIDASDTGYSAIFAGVTQGGASGLNAALALGRNSTNTRSINAGGTVNASGADYAEYMTKAPGCGEIARGEVCGVDYNGQLTRTWADAISFVVKSTDPSYVGGDSWAAHLGPRPEAPAPISAGLQATLSETIPAREKGEEEEAFEQRLSAWYTRANAAAAAQVAFDAAQAEYEAALPVWEAALEAERQKVDRIAFSGQVPVNVSAAVLAQCEAALNRQPQSSLGGSIYLVAAEAPDGGIVAVAVLEIDMTLPLYMRRLGKVWAIRDGRPIIDVQHG